MGTEFDIFAPKLIESAVLETTDTNYKPLASLNQNDLKFLIPADPETYVDLDIKLFVKDQLRRKLRPQNCIIIELISRLCFPTVQTRPSSISRTLTGI